MTTSRLDLADIQGNVLRGYGLKHARHFFVRVDDPAAGRKWLGRVAGWVTTADLQVRANLQARAWPSVAHNVAVTAAGLGALGVPRPVIAAFSEAFREGMAARAGHLGDRGRSAPWRWTTRLGSEKAHILVSVHARTKGLLDDAVGELWHELDPAGLTLIHERKVERLPDNREHFGFADGFAQPNVAGAPPPKQPPPPGSFQSRLLPPGEFLFGHRDLEGMLPLAPPGPLGRNGTYMVYRELAQDVAMFRRFIRIQATRHGLNEDLVAAKIIGRWQNGVPLVVSPGESKPALARNPTDPRLDDFGYAGDPYGFRCPLGAHIRRANPRDALESGVRRTERHRMIRRGMPYGEPLPPGALRDDGHDRGLAFVCFVGSIERQFEFVQAHWCNDGNDFGLGTERDALVGRGEEPGKMTLQGWPPRFLAPLLEFVTTRGGEYLCVPGLEGLHALAAGAIRG